MLYFIVAYPACDVVTCCNQFSLHCLISGNTNDQLPRPGSPPKDLTKKADSAKFHPIHAVSCLKVNSNFILL